MHVVSVAASSRSGPGYELDRYTRGESLEYYCPQTVTSADVGIRIRINVRGLVFETYEQTLAQYPQTLLGSPSKRVEYYNPLSKEYCFDRDKTVFDSILFFYQSCGILSCPEHIPRENFLEEIKFFQLHQADKRYKEEIEPEEVKIVEVELPENPIQRKIWKLFEYPDSSIWADFLAKFSLLIIIMSTITFCIETLPTFGRHTVCRNITSNVLSNDTSLHNDSSFLSNDSQVIVRQCTVIERGAYWSTIEAVYVAWFTFEYVMRVISAPKKVKFITSALGMVDFLAILPYYITLMFQEDGMLLTSFPVLRIIRLIRVLRVLKLSRYSKGLKVLAKTLLISGKDLPSLFAVLIINVILFSSVVYYVENDVKDTDFESIPDAFWWTIITMTAVGYGDKVPKGALGKLIGAICAVSGIVVLFCFPTPVLLSHFEEMYKKKPKGKETQKDDKEEGEKKKMKDTEVRLVGEEERDEIYI
ncbi:potassium voltage-gated channel subfamily A member 2-like [Oculina patagonica]